VAEASPVEGWRRVLTEIRNLILVLIELMNVVLEGRPKHG
jgi:hypothetical protein